MLRERKVPLTSTKKDTLVCLDPSIIHWTCVFGRCLNARPSGRRFWKLGTERCVWRNAAALNRAERTRGKTQTERRAQKSCWPVQRERVLQHHGSREEERGERTKQGEGWSASWVNVFSLYLTSKPLILGFNHTSVYFDGCCHTCVF